MQNVKLAIAIMGSAKAHEESFDRDKANALHAECGEDYTTGQFEQCYKISLIEACEQVAGELARPVYLLLRNSWNDALAWAEEIWMASDERKAELSGAAQGK